MTAPGRPGANRAPIVACLVVLTSSALVLAADIDWCIEANPAFAQSIHSDEVRKVESVRRMSMSVEGMRPDRFLLAKGTLLPILGRLLYEAVDRTPLSGAFLRLCGVAHDSRAGTYLLLRSLSALSSLVLTWLVFRLAWLLSGEPWAGVIAAFFAATTFGGAFSAVIFKSDMLLTALIAAVMVAVVRYVLAPTAGRAAAMGALLGIACAAKYLAALAAVAVAAGWVLLPRRRQRLSHAALAAVSAVAALFVAAPYLFFMPAELLDALRYQMRMQSTPDYHFEGFGFQPRAVVDHLLVSGLGPVLTALSAAGVVYAAWRTVARREWPRYLPLLAYLLVQFAALSLSAWLVVRYTLPMYPVLAALAGVLAWRAGRALAARSTPVSRAGLALLVLLGVAHGLWFLAFDRLLREPPPTVQAAAWLRSHLPPGARVLEIRRRPPLVYGFGAPAERLTAAGVEAMVERGERLSHLDVDFVVVTERSFRQFFRLRSPRFAGHRAFFSELFDNRRFTMVAKFETPACVLGLTLPKGFLPQDLVLIAPDTWIFEVVRPEVARSPDPRAGSSTDRRGERGPTSAGRRGRAGYSKKGTSSTA